MVGRCACLDLCVCVRGRKRGKLSERGKMSVGEGNSQQERGDLAAQTQMDEDNYLFRNTASQQKRA